MNLMLRNLPSVVAVVLLAAAVARAQDPEKVKFAMEFGKLLELNDEKGIDKLVRQQGPNSTNYALVYFQDLRVEVARGKKDLQVKTDALKASVARVFEQTTVMDKLERWIDSQDERSSDVHFKIRNNMIKAWNSFLEISKDPSKRQPFEAARDMLMDVARQMETTGHKLDAAEAWNYVAACLEKFPDRTLEDRKETVQAREMFLSLRQSWAWTQDPYYLQIQNYVKGLKVEIEQKEKEGAKRKADGYGDNVRGLDALAMPGVAEEKKSPAFSVLDDQEKELDYSQKGGPVRPFWWFAQFGKDATEAKLNWFRKVDLFMTRSGSLKFGVSVTPSEAKSVVELDVRGKPTEFFLDADRKVPYALFCWVGSDKERLGEAEVNLAPADAVTNVYYASAASWKVSVGGDTVTLYDDNCSGNPMDGDPFGGEFKMHSLGSGPTVAPLLDSMRIGKGPRVPFSEFVKIGAAWHHIRRTEDRGPVQLGTRPLNPEYLKIGKVKLTWNGPKPTAPVQLVIQGRGDFQHACFDVASGKEVEVPAGSYRVIWGRIAQGKGARVQMATLYGAANEAFTVEVDKVFALKMGAPFKIEFERKGSDTDVQIDATRMSLRESSGCVIAEPHGMSIVPEVLAAKAEDGKGAKVVGKFVKFTDTELLNKAAGLKDYADLGMLLACMPVPADSRDGTMVLTAKVAAGLKVALSMKKHPLFGKLDSAWK